MTLPTGVRGRMLAAFLLLVAALLVVAAVAVPAYVLYNRYDAARTAAEERIDRYRRVAASRADHQRALEVLKARESSRFFLKNSAPNLGGAELTDIVRPALESSGARLTSIQPVTVKDEAGFRLYSLNVGFNATPAALQKTLYTLETAVPYLFLESVTLRATVPRGYKPPPNQEPEVSAQVEIQAYGPKDPARNTRQTGGAPGAQK
ncbi:MAG TPA: type II secretion system protein GspM [Casimicrobium huifangae]|jgi:hypothetical protein|uniref:type II secretion system protein GspM n=1 Tax=Casimicrobium huifangae TaxID=2591109 RepID=UPI0012EBD00E|nr:type II secretion system protein GspM [Casimicrobium huifangae]HOB01238.1 type II secretion system protein GspM [Casimicrobium huifangae]HQA32236.1 type II secretion system protein GspM [Casimicrobium huifangae]HQD65880.1 type II secretion system protein GspM [Casimicrobium huifangae]